MSARQTFSDDRPCWDVHLNVRQYLEQSHKRILPRLKFSLDIETPQWFCTGSEEDTSAYHPILLAAAKYTTLFHPGFDTSPCHNRLDFYEVEDLAVLHNHQEETHQTWERMLAYVPAVKNMEVTLLWRTNISADGDCDDGEYNHVMVKNDEGITVWDVVEVVREALRDTETVLASQWMDEIHGYQRTYGWERIEEA